MHDPSEPRNQSDELPHHYRRPRTTIAPAGPLKMLQVERIEEQVKVVASPRNNISPANSKG